MIQLLSSLIEWLAVATLSSIGIDVEPVACAAFNPAEYRTLDWSSEGATLGWASETASGCPDLLSGFVPIDDTPRLLVKLPASYDS